MAETFTSIHGAIIAGLVASALFAVFARLSTLNLMNMVRYLSTLHSAKPSPALGWVLHFILGSLFALAYAGVWAAGVRTSDFYAYGLSAGIVHWLIAGGLMAAAPRFHAGIRAGCIAEPGPYMARIMGMWGFVAGLAGHMLFGVAFAYVYQFFIYYR